MDWLSADRAIPVIDLFAGPGGLGEGFAALCRPSGSPGFSIALSIEKDPLAHRTLELRAFFRQFPCGEAPDAYYEHLRGELTREELFDACPDAATKARREAWRAELGKLDPSEVRRRIRSALAGSDQWALIGGPPCQAYSKAGRSRHRYRHRNRYNTQYVPEQDPRQFLYVEYLQVLADHRPPVFVMENVKGLLSATLNNQRMFERILDDLHSPAEAIRREGRPVATDSRSHYRIYSLEHATMFGACDLRDFVVHAERHGIPQARHRIILLGIREDLTGVVPPTLASQPEVPAGDVLLGLPRLRSGLSEGEDSANAWKAHLASSLKERWLRILKDNGQQDVHDLICKTVEELRAPQKGRGAEFLEWQPEVGHANEWFLDKRLRGACNHSSRTHMRSDLHRYLFAACFASVRGKSPTLRDFPRELLPDHENVRDALKGGNFSDRFRVQVWSRPSTTVTSHIAKDGHYYIHPDPSQCRSLTVREAARLQTFPDNYAFCGPRTAQYAQVGNAVPPLMAREIARIVWNVLQ